MKSVKLTLLTTSFILLASSFTFNSCKDCGKKEPEPANRGGNTNNTNTSSDTKTTNGTPDDLITTSTLNGTPDDTSTSSDTKTTNGTPDDISATSTLNGTPGCNSKVTYGLTPLGDGETTDGSTSPITPSKARSCNAGSSASKETSGGGAVAMGSSDKGGRLRLNPEQSALAKKVQYNLEKAKKGGKDATAAAAEMERELESKNGIIVSDAVAAQMAQIFREAALSYEIVMQQYKAQEKANMDQEAIVKELVVRMWALAAKWAMKAWQKVEAQDDARKARVAAQWEVRIGVVSLDWEDWIRERVEEKEDNADKSARQAYKDVGLDW
jgi:hypothetical protein